MLPGGLRQPASQPSSALSTRIAAKKAELENLRQLRDLSGTLAMQMQALESKIATLKDGTEGMFFFYLSPAIRFDLISQGRVVPPRPR
jgi:DASH complex subunit DAD2